MFAVYSSKCFVYLNSFNPYNTMQKYYNSYPHSIGKEPEAEND